MTSEKDSGPLEVDFEAAARLVAALERDLQKVSGNSADVQRLRDEVETLKNVLNSPARRAHWVSEGLHDVRGLFERLKDEAVADSVKAGQYVAEIGRILGL
ncbi:MAG: hypothetical protein ABIS45_01320 [Burkholderiales bacterium]